MWKRILLVWIVFTLLVGCASEQEPLSLSERTKNPAFEQGVWLTYSEIDEMLADKNDFKPKFGKVIENCNHLGVTSVYLHVRSFCDSLYPSDLFPLRESVKMYEYDVFDWMLSEFHAAGIRVHAWINPYRVRTDTADRNDLNKAGPALLWQEESFEGEHLLFADGIYWNPASEAVRKLVIDGVREILERYAVDGIHFDDYFYPSAGEILDRNSYVQYCKTAAIPLGLEQWRCLNVDALIAGCDTAIHHLAPDCIFSVSPAASLEQNKNEQFADVEKWVKNNWIDRVIPQLYFGFVYPDETYRFDNLLSVWKSIMPTDTSVELHIGLGCYKIETKDGPDFSEWSESENIIAGQVKICLDDKQVVGCVYFSYRSLFSEAERNQRQRENLKKALG